MKLRDQLPLLFHSLALLCVAISSIACSNIECGQKSFNETWFVREVTMCHIQQSFNFLSEEISSTTPGYVNEGAGAIKFERKTKFLPSGVHKMFPKILRFEATNLTITSVTQSSFINLIHLEVILLQHNNIASIDKKVFQDLRNLRILKIDHNSISYIDVDAFFTNQNLRILNLTNNPLFEVYKYESRYEAFNCVKENFKDYLNCTQQLPKICEETTFTTIICITVFMIVDLSVASIYFWKLHNENLRVDAP